MGTSENRIAKWDNVKAVLIILVVIGHMMKSDLELSGFSSKLYYFIYLFHMPAFIFVSGMFSKSTIEKKNYDRVFSFFLLYLLIKFLSYFSTLIIVGKDTVRMFTETGAAWYALALAVYYLLTMFLRRYSRGFVLVLSIVMGCAAGYCKDIGNFLALSRIFTFYPFFLMGYYIKPSQLLGWTEKRKVKLASAVVLAAFFALAMRFAQELAWTVSLLKGNSAYTKLAYLAEWGGALRLAQYIVGVLLTFCVIAVVPRRRSRFSYIGQRTRAIYALHWLLINIFYNGLQGEIWAKEVWHAHYQMVYIVVAVLISVLLSWKPFDTLVGKLVVPGERKRDG